MNFTCTTLCYYNPHLPQHFFFLKTHTDGCIRSNLELQLSCLTITSTLRLEQPRIKPEMFQLVYNLLYLQSRSQDGFSTKKVEDTFEF